MGSKVFGEVTGSIEGDSIEMEVGVLQSGASGSGPSSSQSEGG